MADETLIKQFLQNQARFMGYLLAVTRDLHAAEEIFQNAAMAVIKGPEGPVGDFLAWSKEVVRRQALYYLRERNRQTGRLRSLDPALLESISLAFQEDATEPDHARRERDALAACLRKLPGRSGEILARRYEHRESFEEIARATRSTASAIQRAISRVRRMLHDCVRLRLGEAS
jgi:RNA polymerase sigma-70 factor (ECF subfamily)